MHCLDGTLAGVKYRDNIHQNYVIPHFDDRNFASHPIFIDDNARPHRAQIVQQYLQDEAIECFLGQLSHLIGTPKSRSEIKSGKL